MRDLARRVYFLLVRWMPIYPRRHFVYALHHGRLGNFRRPQRFTEKINWRILNDRGDDLIVLCDKIAVKQHVTALAGGALRVPRTYWSGRDLGELDVELPSSWVLKPNHTSGKILFGGGQPNPKQLKHVTSGWLKEFNGRVLGEWAYAQVRPAFLIEERIGDDGADLLDYKVFVFNGVPFCIMVDRGALASKGRVFYSPGWERLDIKTSRPVGTDVSKPSKLADLLLAASRISGNRDFVRVDLYIYEDEVWFGELSPYSGSGNTVYTPDMFDYELGAQWLL